MYVSWTTQHVELVATKIKDVVCENCRQCYAYSMTRSEHGSGTSLYGIDNEGAQQRAFSSANAGLENALESAMELVPCPNCGAYQSDMVRFLRNTHLKWLYLFVPALALAAAGASCYGL